MSESQEVQLLSSPRRLGAHAAFAIRNILLLSILSLITILYIAHKSHKPQWCLVFSLCFFLLSTKDLFHKTGGLIRWLLQGKKPIYQLSIKKILFPEVFAISGVICFLLLFMKRQFGGATTPTFGLFLPILLLGFAYISNLFLNSPYKSMSSVRRWCVGKLYRRNPFLIKVYLLTSYIVSFGLIVAYSFFVFKGSLYHLDWYFFGFFDKRVHYLTYLLFMVGFLFLPYFYSALVLPRAFAPPLKSQQGSRSIFQRVAPPIIGALIALYFWGPPWNIDLYAGTPDPHEVVHLSPLLAIQQGKMPYSEAPIQYGPGVQLFQFLYMNQFGFDLHHLREGFFVLHFGFALIFFVCIWMYLDVLAAAIVSFLCLYMDNTLHLFSFNDQGGPAGFFGWGVGFRYVAPPLLAMAMAYQFTQAQSQKGHPFFVGCMYGFLLYMAQENFSCGIFTLVLGSGLAYASKYTTFKNLRRIGTYFLLGAALSITPVLIFYFYHHQLLAFISQYFRVSSAVVAGFSNTRWSTGVHSIYFLPYLLTPIILFAIGFYALYFKKKGDFAIEKDRFRLLLLLISAISLHQISLFRADSTHFRATCLALPIVFGLIFSEVVKRERAYYASLFLLLMIAIYPVHFDVKSFIPAMMRPSIRYTASIPLPSKDAMFFEPFGFYRDPMSNGSTDTDAKTFEFIAEMKAVKQILGEKATIVDFNFPCTSNFYFFANLNIGTSMMESYHSVINSLDRKKFVEEIRSNPIQAFITNDLQSRETLVFLERFPQATVDHRFFGQRPYYILCSPISESHAK